MEQQIIYDIIIALTFFGLFSALYRRTKVFTALSNVLIGVTTAQVVLGNINILQNTLLPKISGGDYIYIFAILIGLIYFAALSSKLRPLYRAVTVIMAATGLGLTLNLSMVKVWDWVYNFSVQALTGIGPLIALFFLATGIANFLFSRVLEGPTRVPREIGRIGILAYMSFLVGSSLTGYAGSMVYFMSQIFMGSAWWVPVIIFVGIIMDALGIFGKKQPEKIEVSP